MILETQQKQKQSEQCRGKTRKQINNAQIKRPHFLRTQKNIYLENLMVMEHENIKEKSNL